MVLFKRLDGLRLAVLKHFEIGLGEIVHGVMLCVGDHHIHHNQVGVGLDGGGGLRRGGLSGRKRRITEQDSDKGTQKRAYQERVYQERGS